MDGNDAGKQAKPTVEGHSKGSPQEGLHEDEVQSKILELIDALGVSVIREKRIESAGLIAGGFGGRDLIQFMNETGAVRLCEVLSTDGVLGLEKFAGLRKYTGVKSDRTIEDMEWLFYHAEISRMIVLLQVYYPETLMKYFAPIAQYLIDCTNSPILELCSSACAYWSSLRFNQIYNLESCATQWRHSFKSSIGGIVPALLACMTYQDEHAAYIEKNAPQGAEPGVEEELEEPSAKISSYSELRNLAALSFENLCRAFREEMVRAFKPHLVDCFGSASKGSKSAATEVSDDWKKREAVTLALSALTKALGTHELLMDQYPQVIPRILEGYKDPKPLIRSVCCFTMPHFINFELPGSIPDPTPKVFTLTLELLSDEYLEVRWIAIRSLATLLAYSRTDVTPYVDKTVEALVQADPGMFGESRCPYVECIGHLFGRAATKLASFDIDRLLAPLMAHWGHIEAIDHFDDDDDEDVDVVTLSTALCTIAYHLGKGFAPYVDKIFAKASDQIAKVLAVADRQMKEERSAREGRVGRSRIRARIGGIDLGACKVDGGIGEAEASKNNNCHCVAERRAESIDKKCGAETEEGEEGKEREERVPNDVFVCHLLSCLDLLGVVYDGMEADAASYATKYHIVQLIMTILKVPSFHSCVRQSAVALLAHIARYRVTGKPGGKGGDKGGEKGEEAGDEPKLSEFLDIITEMIKLTGCDSCKHCEAKGSKDAAEKGKSTRPGVEASVKTPQGFLKPRDSTDAQKVKTNALPAVKHSDESCISSLTTELERVDLESDARCDHHHGDYDTDEICTDLRCNALWALVFIAKDPSTSRIKLFELIDDLIVMFKQTSGHIVGLINAAWALTTICALCPERTAAVVLRDDVFLHLVGLLQSRFPQPELEQVEIFKNFAAMLGPVIGKVSADKWKLFVGAVAAVAELKDEGMHGALRALMRRIKECLGDAQWKELMQNVGGKNVAAGIIKKYELV